MNYKISPKSILVICLVLVACVFSGVSLITYHQFSESILDIEQDSQKQLVQIVDKNLTRYFKNLKFTVENAVLHPDFQPDNNKLEDVYRFLSVSEKQAKKRPSGIKCDGKPEKC